MSFGELRAELHDQRPHWSRVWALVLDQDDPREAARYALATHGGRRWAQGLLAMLAPMRPDAGPVDLPPDFMPVDRAALVAWGWRACVSALRPTLDDVAASIFEEVPPELNIMLASIEGWHEGREPLTRPLGIALAFDALEAPAYGNPDAVAEDHFLLHRCWRPARALMSEVPHGVADGVHPLWLLADMAHWGGLLWGNVAVHTWRQAEGFTPDQLPELERARERYLADRDDHLADALLRALASGDLPLVRSKGELTGAQRRARRTDDAR